MEIDWIRPIRTVSRHNKRSRSSVERGTWVRERNAGRLTSSGEAPPTDLEPWIPKNKYDLYIINTQECNYSPPKMAGNTNIEQDWFDHIQTHLGKGYVKLCYISLFYIRIIVCIRREHYYKVTEIESSHVATGIGEYDISSFTRNDESTVSSMTNEWVTVNR